MRKRDARRSMPVAPPPGPGVGLITAEMDPNYDPPSTSLTPPKTSPCECNNCPTCGRLR